MNSEDSSNTGQETGDARSRTPDPVLFVPGFVTVYSERVFIELTEEPEDADPLPSPLPFAEGTCEC